MPLLQAGFLNFFSVFEYHTLHFILCRSWSDSHHFKAKLALKMEFRKGKKSEL